MRTEVNSNQRTAYLMNRPWTFVAACALVVISCPIECFPAWAAQIELADDAPQPLTPEESRQRFRLPAGFRIELVAAEPHLADPVAICFDARGRVFVTAPLMRRTYSTPILYDHSTPGTSVPG